MVNFLDIFAGAGGLSEGFVRAGYSPICHIEMDSAACYTLRTRAAFHYLMQNDGEDIYRKYLVGEISRDDLYSSVPEDVIDSVIHEEISASSIVSLFNKIESYGKKVDLIIGGPPCQAYSLAGRSRDPNRMIGDKRNYLYTLYAEFLERFQPKYFVFENVIGLLSAKDEDGELHLYKMRALFKEKGYNTELRVLDSSQYGVLQKRKRIIIIGKRGDDSGFYPEIEPSIIKCTVDSVFSDLPSIHAGEGSCYAPRDKGSSETYSSNSLSKLFHNQIAPFKCRLNKHLVTELIWYFRSLERSGFSLLHAFDQGADRYFLRLFQADDLMVQFLIFSRIFNLFAEELFRRHI